VDGTFDGRHCYSAKNPLPFSHVITARLDQNQPEPLLLLEPDLPEELSDLAPFFESLPDFSGLGFLSWGFLSFSAAFLYDSLR
jgi:hypothetical protein